MSPLITVSHHECRAPPVPYAEMVVMKAESEAAKEKEMEENTQREANARKTFPNRLPALPSEASSP